MKYNRSEIMKLAHEIRALNPSVTKSEALRDAWAVAKAQSNAPAIPELKGSAKQVKWAGDIISGGRRALVGALRVDVRMMRGDIDICLALLRQYDAMTEKLGSAGQIIDRRESFTASALLRRRDTLSDMRRAGKDISEYLAA